MNDTPEQPRKEEDGQATDRSPDRAQPELTEQKLVYEQREETNDPERKEDLEDDLSEMEDDIEEANQE